MLIDPLPNICRVYSYLVQQERQVVIPLDEPNFLSFPNQNQSSQYKHNPNFHGKGTKGGMHFGGGGRGT